MTRGLIALGLALLASPALAQNTPPLSPPGAGGSSQTTPKPTPDRGVTSDPPSIIHPSNPDPGMSVTPPQSGMTPVIPPPGTVGGSPTVVPK